jgi:GTP-dependent dephospho-CoA kinase
MSHDVKPVHKEIIDYLRKPLGELISYDQVERHKIIELRHATHKLITVGDTTTAKVISFSVVPDVSVVDGFEKRLVSTTSISKLKSMITAALSGDVELVEFSCTNRPGSISLQAINILIRALMSPTPVLVNVIGEEDLITLPLIAYAPTDSRILYGQPSEGIVVVRVANRIQEVAKRLMRRIGFNLEGV